MLLFAKRRRTATAVLVVVGLSSMMALSASSNEPQHSSSGVTYDLPPLLDSDDVAYFFERNQLQELHDFLKLVFERSQRNPHYSALTNNDNDNMEQQLPPPLAPPLVARGGGDTYTTAHKLTMDLEQAEYLAHNVNASTPDDIRTFLIQRAIPIYKHVLSHIPPLEDLKDTYGLYAFTEQDYQAGIASVYNKALYVTDYDTLRDGNTPIPLLNANLSAHQVEQEYKTHNGIVVVDNLLSPQALNRIRQLLLESTVWFQTKMPLKFGAYNGAYLDDGLYDYILLQLAMELSQAFPTIFAHHPLRYMWAYKYDSNLNTTGIHIHADQAAVNVNLWLTPDEEANLDWTSGGLVVYTAKPPAHWDFSTYNTNTQFVRDQLLAPTDYANVTIAHRQNRAVIFDSALFHHSDSYKFRSGYENRRINLTFLYGKMQTASPIDSATKQEQNQGGSSSSSEQQQREGRASADGSNTVEQEERQEEL